VEDDMMDEGGDGEEVGYMMLGLEGE